MSWQEQMRGIIEKNLPLSRSRHKKKEKLCKDFQFKNVYSISAIGTGLLLQNTQQK
jgi:hypothetical protein